MAGLLWVIRWSGRVRGRAASSVVPPYRPAPHRGAIGHASIRCASVSYAERMASASTGPHVVIVGGYLTEPLFYRPMRARLLERGAARVSVAPLHVPDWLAAAFVGFGPALRRVARAIREARGASDMPLIVVGHSAGGIVARLALSSEPFDGRRGGVAGDVGCLVTVGTPHVVRPHARWDGHAGQRATRFLARTCPGAWFAPSTRYVTVGSTAVAPRAADPAPVPKRLLNRILTDFVGPSGHVGGDGIVTEDLDAPRRGAPRHAPRCAPRHARRTVVWRRARGRPLVAGRGRRMAPGARGARGWVKRVQRRLTSSDPRSRARPAAGSSRAGRSGRPR